MEGELNSDQQPSSSQIEAAAIPMNMLESNLSEANESNMNDDGRGGGDESPSKQQYLHSNSNLSDGTNNEFPRNDEGEVNDIHAPASPTITDLETIAADNKDEPFLTPTPATPAAAAEAGEEARSANIELTQTASSDISFNFDIDEHQLHHHDGNILDEQELKSLAQSLAPRVTSLLDTNEKVLEHLINDELRLSFRKEDDDDNDEIEGGDGNNVKKKLFNGRSHNASSANDIDSDFDEDENYDGIEDEWNGLSNAEQILRDELGMVSMGFNFVTNNAGVDDDGGENLGVDDGVSLENEDNYQEDDNTSVQNEQAKIAPTKEQTINKQNLLDQAMNQESTSSLLSDQMYHTAAPLPSSANRQTYTLHDHAKCVDLQFSNVDLGYPSCPLLTKEDAEALLDIPSFRHEMLSMEKINNLVVDGTELSDSQHTGSEHSVSATNEYDLGDNDDLQRSMGTQFKDTKSRQEAIREIMLCTREYVKPMTRSALSRIYEGLVDRVHGNKLNGKLGRLKKQRAKNNQGEDQEEEDRGIVIASSQDEDHGEKASAEVLPIRTVAIQIRPDVLCGAVMDAVHTAIHSLRGEITRRQGNHLRALVPGCWVPETSYVTFRPHDGNDLSNSFANMLTPVKSSDNLMNGMAFLPPFVVDAQLCARKRSRDGERICLFRFFRIEENQVVDGSLICPPSPPHASIDSFNADLIPDLKECNSLLRESSALFQRMRVVAKSGGNIGFDINAEHDDLRGMSRPKTDKKSSEKNDTMLKQVLTSPLKLFSPSKSKKNKPQPRKKNSKKSLSVRFQSTDSLIQGEKAAQEFASMRLLQSFEATPSVVDENDYPDFEPIPSLCAEDWPFVQSSWRYITLCLNELDNRDLNYR